MPLAPQWRTEVHDHRWSVAQVNATYNKSVESLLEMRGVRAGGTAISSHCFELEDDDAYLHTVAYELVGSDWTFLEGVQGVLDSGRLKRLSKKLKTDVLEAMFEDSVGCAAWICYRNGRAVAAAETGDPEFFDPTSDCYEGRTPDGKEGKWITNSLMTFRSFGDLAHELDIETATFETSWQAIADRLGTDVPYLKWSLVRTDPVTYELNNADENLVNSVLLELK